MLLDFYLRSEYKVNSFKKEKSHKDYKLMLIIKIIDYFLYVI